MPDEKLQYVIDIIRESADFDTEREEIDIEIDKIDTVTQRKLQNFVLKNKPKQRGKTQKKQARTCKSRMRRRRERRRRRHRGTKESSESSSSSSDREDETEQKRNRTRARLIERKWLEKEGGDPDVGQTERGWRGAVGRILF